MLSFMNASYLINPPTNPYTPHGLIFHLNMITLLP